MVYRNRTYENGRELLRYFWMLVILVVTLIGMMTQTTAFAAASSQKNTDETGIATPSSVVEEKLLTMDSKAYVFSNSTDGMFRLSFAEGKSYYLGCAEDTDTMVTYALIKYGTKLYLVVADDSDGAKSLLDDLLK